MSPNRQSLTVITPVDSTEYKTIPLSTTDEVQAAAELAQAAFKTWSRSAVSKRVEIGRRFLEALGARKDELAKELTYQMGRPIRYTPGEISGTMSRGQYMLDVAEETLKDVEIPEGAASIGPGFKRFIRKEPLGVVLIVA
ncbi:hypothetical protein DFQ26_007271, partial [Actinomortierella ambigua]